MQWFPCLQPLSCNSSTITWELTLGVCHFNLSFCLAPFISPSLLPSLSLFPSPALFFPSTLSSLLFLSLPWGSRKLWMLSEEHSQWLWWAPPPPLVSTLLVLLIHLLCLVLTVLGTSCNSLSLYYLSSFFLSQLLKHVWNKHPLLNYLLLK